MTDDTQERGLERKLTPRQLTMIAIGGAIGVGLFLGSGVTVALAGPAVIVTYLVAAVIALIMAGALAELAVVHPMAGSFGVYAERYVNRWTGFVVRATYGFIQILAIGAEVTAVGIYFAFWFPDVPQWMWVALVSAGLVAVNAAQVHRFGEFEYWFALIKVVAIVAFIACGLAVVVGLAPGPAAGLGNWTKHGGFAPHGWRGAWLAMTLVITSYMGIEVIAVTAGEAERPEVSIPRAMRTIALRLIIFYVLAVAVMLAMTPWDEIVGAGGTLTASPFVRAFARVGIPAAATIMNLVVITAALSSANTNLYLSTRMLFSLARGGYAPAFVGRLSAGGVPRAALGVSTGGMIAAILLAVFSASGAFLMLFGTAVAGMLFVWAVVLVTHLRFRRAVDPARIAALQMRLPWHPLPSSVGLVAIAAIMTTTFFVDGLRYTVPSYAVFLGAASLVYTLTGPRHEEYV